MSTNSKIAVGLIAAYAAFVWARTKGVFGVSGIGDIPAWNKKHIHDFLAYEHYGYPNMIVIDPTYTDHLGRKLVEAYPGEYWRGSNRTFWVNKENEAYLVELAERNNVIVVYRNPYER